MFATGLGVAFALLTVLATTRFMLSFHPNLERLARRERRWPWRAFTLLDPVLQPVKREWFALEEEDPDYAAVALLAIAASILVSTCAVLWVGVRGCGRIWCGGGR